MEGDLDLLGLAAKAAGLIVAWNDELGEFEMDYGVGFSECWNPLTDDGDALRMAVKLGLSIEFDRYPSTTMTTGKAFRVRIWSFGWHKEDFDDDGLAATRRAIVRAAAYAYLQQLNRHRS